MFRQVLSIFIGLTISSCAFSNDFYIDSRSEQEFMDFNIPGTINIPHDKILEGVIVNNIQKDDSIYIFCRSGRRASNAKAVLNTNGYNNVINLGGIIEADKYIKSNNVKLNQ